MLKRVLMMLALGAALVACSPAGSGTSTDGTETLAPIDSAAPSDGLQSEDPLASPSDPLASPS